MIVEIQKALLNQRQYLSGRQKACFIVIAVLVVLIQFCVMGVTIAVGKYWLLVSELPLLLLAILAMNFLRAAVTSLDAPAIKPNSN